MLARIGDGGYQPRSPTFGWKKGPAGRSHTPRRKGSNAERRRGVAAATSSRAATDYVNRRERVIFPSANMRSLNFMKSPLSGLHHKERWLSFGAIAGEGGDGEGLGGALPRGGEHGASAGVTGFWRRREAIRRCSRGSWKADETLASWRAGRARAGWDARHGGGAARRRSAAKASRCRFSWRQPSGTTVERCAAQGRCGGAHGCSTTRWSRLTPCWSPTVARATHLAPPRSG